MKLYITDFPSTNFAWLQKNIHWYTNSTYWRNSNKTNLKIIWIQYNFHLSHPTGLPFRHCICQDDHPKYSAHRADSSQINSQINSYTHAECLTVYTDESCTYTSLGSIMRWFSRGAVIQQWACKLDDNNPRQS